VEEGYISFSLYILTPLSLLSTSHISPGGWSSPIILLVLSFSKSSTPLLPLLFFHEYALTHHIFPFLYPKYTQGQVQDTLAGIMNGTIALTAVHENGTSLPVQDSICSAKTTLSFVPPSTDTLDDQSNVKDGFKPLSPLYIALIAVAGVTVLFAAIFLARRHMAPKPRSAVVASS